jgi:hypothetical protein
VASQCRHSLLALFAPGSVEAEVGAVQQGLFSSYGLASACAISPLIPVVFLAPDAGIPIESIGKAAPSPYMFASKGLQWEGGTLYLSLDTAGVWDALRKEILEAGLAAEESLFPPHEGFCLGSWEASEIDRRNIDVAAPLLRFSSCALAILSLSVSTERPAWWREVHTEVTERRPLR